jgi:hypothetical protein
MQEAAKAQFLVQLVELGIVDPAAAAGRLMDAMEIGNVEELMPKPDPMAPVMQQMQMQSMMGELTKMKAEIELTLAKVEQAKAAAYADIAGVENTDAAQNLDALRLILEDERGRIDAAINAGRLAGKPGDGGGSGASQGGVGTSQGAGNVSISVGPGLAGAGASGAFANGGMG